MAVDSSTSSSDVLPPCNFSEGVSEVGGAEKTGIACLIRTGGATPVGRSWAAGGGGGAENTGTELLIVTGGAMPW